MKVIKEYSSEEVIEGLQKKDKEVFRFLFEKYFGQLVHFAEYFLLEREAAENVVQDCFLNFGRKLIFPIFVILILIFLYKLRIFV